MNSSTGASLSATKYGRVGRAIGGLGASAGGEDGRVLEQQDGVGCGAGHDLGVHLALEVPGGHVLESVGAEPGLTEDHDPNDTPAPVDDRMRLRGI